MILPALMLHKLNYIIYIYCIILSLIIMLENSSMWLYASKFHVYHCVKYFL